MVHNSKNEKDFLKNVDFYKIMEHRVICFLFIRKEIVVLEVTEVKVCFIQDTKYKLR